MDKNTKSKVKNNQNDPKIIDYLYKNYIVYNSCYG